MALINAHPLRFSPQGLSDALAEEDAFPGACSVLTNLVPDPSTKNLWTPRPASIEQTNAFAGFSSPAGVSVFKVVGSYVFGLVSTALTAGKDQPFCFNLLTSSFVSVTGVTSSNVPATQSTAGDWTPPTMDVMGTNLVVTHPGFDGVTNFIGWFDITVLSAPVWHAGNFKLINTISTITLTAGGSGYTTGTYTAVPLTGGNGSGAQATIVVNGSHVVSSVTITNPGLFYKVGDQLSAPSTVLGTGGVGLVITVNTVNGAGIQNITIVNPGAGYTDNTYMNIALGGGSGTGATGNFVVTGGQVTSVVPDTPGSGYLSGDFLVASQFIKTFTVTPGSNYIDGIYTNVALQGGTGSGALFTITVSGGKVIKVVVTNPGSGYSVSDSLTFTLGSIQSTGAPQSLGAPALTPGDYFNVNQLSTTGVGVGALFDIEVAAGGGISIVFVAYGGTGYAAGDTVFFPGATFGSPSTTLYQTVIAVTSPIGPGTGFSITVSTISDSLGAGTGLRMEVLTTTPAEGFINFTTVPSWVRQFNGRSWFGINPPTGIPSVIFSDVYALNCTNANQALSFGDNTPLTAAATLGLANLLGGVVQSLIIFKSLNGIIQVTGDATTNNLSVNQVPGGSGTLSPRSVCEHPQGLLYLDHDGYRMVTLDGNCTDPIGVAGQGVVVPFLNPTNKTRVNAGCNGTILRVSVDTESNGWQEYWFDTVRKVWSGPHTFPSTMIDTYEGDFILAAQSMPVGLYLSQVTPSTSSTFTENGSPLAWEYQTVVLNDNQQMAQSEIAEMQVKMNAVSGVSSVAVAAIENGTTINSSTPSLATPSQLAAYRIDFNAPVVYNRLTIQITGASAARFVIGDIYVRSRVLGYIQALPV